MMRQKRDNCTSKVLEQEEVVGSIAEAFAISIPFPKLKQEGRQTMDDDFRLDGKGMKYLSSEVNVSIETEGE